MLGRSVTVIVALSLGIGTSPVFTQSLWAKPAVASLTSSDCAAQFQRQVTTLLERPDLARAQWGIVFQPLTAPTPLLSYQADKLFIPASTQKLVTTAIALVTLGPNFRFQTPVYAQTSLRHPDRLTTLQVMASGDPTLQPSNLAIIAKKLKSQGIREIQRLELVDAIAPEQAYRPSWEWDDLIYNYAPSVNRAILADNQVTLTLTPQTLGRPLAVSWSEAIAGRQWQVTNRTRAVTQPQQPLKVHAIPGTRQLIVEGELAIDAEPDKTDLAIPDPAQYFLDTLQQTLTDHGITVNQTQIRRESLPVAAQPLWTLTSPPLSDLIQTINQNSDNLYAEALFNQLAPSPDPIQEVWQTQLATWGIADTDWQVKDGSGLSRQNLISPAALVKIIAAMAQSPSSTVFLDSLARSGESGTLKNRFLNTPLAHNVRGKTGTLSGVVALAGVVEHTSLGPVAFSIMVNNSDLSAPILRAALDQIVQWSASVTPCNRL